MKTSARPPLLRLAFGLIGVAVFLLLFLPDARAGTFKRITIDGNFDDWVGVPLAHEDPADATTSADYRRIWIANDDDFLYLRFTLERPDDPFTANDNLFIDADADSTTGFGIIVGSEMLVQGGNGYQERDGGFNEGGIEGLQWQAAPTGSGTQFEARLSRKAVFASDQSPVFGGGSIAILLEAEDANFARQETAPDAEGLPYDFAEPPPPFTGSATLVPLNATWRMNSTGTRPGDSWTSPDEDDTGAGWSGGGALLGYTPNPGAYPAPIATALPTGPVTHYLRTRFAWNQNAADAVFVVTNYLSDGAAFYLNGAEVRRLRLPAGPLTATTPATGSPATAGQAEVFALPAGPLVQGDNVLAVEIHQSPASPNDLVFGLSLLATTSYPVVFTDPEQPADRSVVGGESTTFAAEVIGSAPLTYAWFRDGQPIPGATDATLRIDPVLPDDAGTYTLRVSNAALPAGVTSRPARLTVVNVPVVITRPPQALTVAEGQSATFTVEATGSAPVSYQWFKDGQPLAGRTDATLTLANVSQADGGDYAVEVANPAPNPVRSAPARLTVVRDAVGPALVRIAGGPNRVRLTFSEPVDPPSAQTLSNYSLSGGLTATSAVVDAADPTSVLLGTSRQTLGTSYSVAARNLKDRFGNVADIPATSFLSTIQIDGSFDDWTDVPQVVDDPEDAEGATDYAAAWITSDRDYVYLRVRLHRASDLAIFYNNLFIDTDADPATGFPFRGLGSEMLIQGGGGYQQKGGAFNEGTIENLDWRMVPEGPGTEFELRFSRAARYATDGQPVFVADSITLFLESENTSFQTIDVAPDAEPIVHQLLNPLPPDLGRLTISQGTPSPTITWTGAGRLQSTPSLVNPNWQDVPGAASPHTVIPTGNARFYRLTQ